MTLDRHLVEKTGGSSSSGLASVPTGYLKKQYFSSLKIARDNEYRIIGVLSGTNTHKMKQLDTLNLLISNHKNNTRTIANAESLLKNTEPLLADIVNNLGENAPVYLKYSTEIISIAIDNITSEIETVNATAEKKRDQYPEEADTILRITYSNAWAVINIMENMYMYEKFMTEQYYPFRDSILDYCQRLNIHPLKERRELSARQIIMRFIGLAQFVICVFTGEISIEIAFILLLITLIIWIYQKNSE